MMSSAISRFVATTAVALASALSLVPVCAQGTAPKAQLVPAQSEIAFTSRQMGVPVDGKFRKFDAQVAFDPKKPETASIAFTIDLGSITLGAPESEAEVVKPLWFNVARFPQASFQSTSVKATGPGKFDVAGKLNIKGNARDVVVPVALAQAGAATTATGAFVIKRIDFKIGEGEWADTSMVANDVQVKFKLQLNGVGAL
jgi:polyisoprenoid-binding protein YceI